MTINVTIVHSRRRVTVWYGYIVLLVNKLAVCDKQPTANNEQCRTTLRNRMTDQTIPTYITAVFIKQPTTNRQMPRNNNGVTDWPLFAIIA